VLGEIADRLGDQLAVYAFTAKTRNACRVFEVDKYEGRHGTADIRMSLREAHRDEIVARALTIDKTARGHLGRTFGPGAWHLMTDPTRLPQVLTEVYGRLSQ